MQRALIASALLLVTACGGSSGGGWQEAYRAELDVVWEAADAASQVSQCLLIADFSDETLALRFSLDAGESESNFARVMRAEGIDPTTEIVEESIEVAVEDARSKCS